MRQRTRIGGAVFAATVAWLAAAGSVAGQEPGFTPFPGEPSAGEIPIIKGVKSLEKGAPAPVFKVRDTEGKEHDFAVEATRRAHLLVFWSIFCEPCRVEMPIVETLHQKYRERLSVVAIALDGEPLKSSIVGFVRQEGVRQASACKAA